tara:strand:- start:803 stop:1219 length:417 start_codon:yes stop_codon:yes gene_type:complete
MEQRLDAIEKKLETLIKLMSETPRSSPKTKAKTKKQVKVEKSGSAIVSIYTDLILITGNTFSNKDNLKSIGARWNKENKGWQFNADQIESVREKVAEVFESTSFKEMNKSLKKPVESDGEDNADQVNSSWCEIDSDSD